MNIDPACTACKTAYIFENSFAIKSMCYIFALFSCFAKFKSRRTYNSIICNPCFSWLLLKLRTATNILVQYG